MPTFNDQENKLMFQPAGDYKFTVIEHEKKISQGAKTAGSTVDNLKLEITSKDGKATSHVYTSLIDHPSCVWKYDVFLKCCGIKLAKGQSFELSDDTEMVDAINPLGLRGWCNVSLGKDTKGRDRNEVAVFYTDKEKLARVEINPFDA